MPLEVLGLIEESGLVAGGCEQSGEAEIEGTDAHPYRVQRHIRVHSLRFSLPTREKEFLSPQGGGRFAKRPLRFPGRLRATAYPTEAARCTRPWGSRAPPRRRPARRCARGS